MLLGIFVVAMLASLAITPLVTRVAVAKGFVEAPVGGRRIHTRAVPRLGGVAVFAAMVCGLLAAVLLELVTSSGRQPQWEFYAGVLLGGGILFVTGLVDDLREIRPLSKLLAQIAAATLVYALGLRIEVLGWGSTGVSLGLMSLPITILWIVGVTNAYNLIDGLDGLATGIAVVALGTMLCVSLALGKTDVAVVSVALLGALLGFLRYNFNPARIFLGDSGSMSVGFLLAVLSVHGATKSATAVLALVPLFALALPLIDTTFAILRRWLRGSPISGADKRHIHHRLLEIGLTTRRAVLVLYVVATIFATLGVLIAFAPPTMVTVAAIAGGVLSLGMLLIGIRHLDYYEFEAVGSVLVQGPSKLRKILSDRVHAQDLARLIPTAKSLEEINAVLVDSVEIFRFGYMEICRLDSRESRELARVRWGASAWKIDYPVSQYDPESGDWFVLRIWCHMRTGFRPYGAERVASIIGPSVEAWLSKHDLPRKERVVTRRKTAT